MTDKEFKSLVSNINRQMRRIEEHGYEKLSLGYQKALHATQRITNIKSSHAQFSSKKELNTEKNVKILQTIKNQLSLKHVTKKIKERAEQEQVSTFTAKAELESEAVFANMVETLSSFYDSKQISQLLTEYDETPSYIEWLTDILMNEGQLLHDRSPEDFKILINNWADMTGAGDKDYNELLKELNISSGD